MNHHIYKEDPPEWARPYYRKTQPVAIGFVFLLRHKGNHDWLEDVTVIGSHVGARVRNKKRSWYHYRTREEAMSYARRYLSGHRKRFDVIGPVPVGLDARAMNALKQKGEVPSHYINQAYKLALAGAEIYESKSGKTSKDGASK